MTYRNSFKILAGIALFMASPAAAETSAAERMFATMTSLAGEWEGEAVWSGGRTSRYPLQANYYLTANGSAIVENLVSDGTPSMTSVYHMDGPDLRMTHYCGVRNQPRLKADRVNDSGKEVHFAFVDATNIGPKNQGHVHEATIGIHDANTLQIQFTFAGGSAPISVEKITLKRVLEASSTARAASPEDHDHGS